MIAATMPTRMVSHNGTACLPGMTNFASTPRMRPTMIAPMML